MDDVIDTHDDCACEVTTGEVSRRRLIGSFGLVGLTAAAGVASGTQLAFADGAAGDTLVVVFLRGGMDSLSAVVPYTDKAYYAARPGLAVPASRVVKLDGQFGLHPALGPLRDSWVRGQLAVVNAVGSPANSRSHFDAQEFIERGTPGSKTIPTGWLGRHLQSRPGKSSFRAISMGGSLQTSLQGPEPALSLRSLDEFRLSAPPPEQAAVQWTLRKLYGQLSHPMARQADAAIDAVQKLAKLSGTAYKPAGGARYPASDLGHSLSDVARLLRSGLPLEVAAVDANGWDLHQNSGTWSSGRMHSLLDDLALSLKAFTTDIAGLMGRVSVIVMSEFGRRVDQNGSGGTDHGYGGTMFVIGGGIQGGRVYGRWPGLAKSQRVGGDIAVTTDYRAILSEVLVQRVGNRNVGTVFPGYKYAPIGLTKPR